MLECFINWFDLIDAHPATYEMRIVGKLQDAGIPVRGLFSFQGVERGVIVWHDVWNGRQFFWKEEKK
jgi:hypothetical protein